VTAPSQAPTQACADDVVSIGDAAKATGVSTRALRYYEEMGLVRPAAHSPGGHRLYAPAQCARVRRIRQLQDLMGFNLAEISEILANEDRLDSLRDEFHRHEDPAHRLRIAEEALTVMSDLDARVEAKQKRLAEFRQAISERRRRAEVVAAELQQEAP